MKIENQRLRDENNRLKGVITYVKDRPGHDRRYAIDSSKLQRDLGWTPEESFQSGIEKTLAWYLAHPSWIERVRSGAYQDWIREQYEA